MSRPRQIDPLFALVERALPNVKVDAVSPIHSQKATSQFDVRLTDGRTLLLHLSSSPSKLLRSERWIIPSEAAVIEWLTESKSQQPIGKDVKREEGQDRDSNTEDTVNTPICSYLPTMIKRSLPSDSGVAYSLFEPMLGSPISSLGTPPTGAERESIEYQKGRLLRQIVRSVSPSGKFGLAVVVLNPSLTLKGAREEARDSSVDIDGMDSWRKTFHLLLEGILRDGEDLAVTISYELVRSTFRKFGHLLDAVTTPRLVAYDADDDEVVLVTRKQSREEPRLGCDWEKGEETVVKADPDASPTDTGGGSGGNLGDDDPAIQITGLRDWSNCIFGDPLFAPGFSRSGPAFERGFRATQHGSPRESRRQQERELKKEESVLKEEYKSEEQEEEEDDVKEEEEEYSGWQEGKDMGVVEDPENAQTRILLYECYHATVSIVTQFYRPEPQSSSRREIAARRRLVAALNKLSHLETDEGTAGKRPRRRSSALESPAKRPRGDTPTPKQESKLST